MAKRKYIFSLVIVFLCLVLFDTAYTEENMKNKIENKISFNEFKWLVGRWKGEAFGGVFEEVWLPPSAGSMCGTFKLIVNDKVSFYEIFIITIDSTGPVLKLKHFNADLTGWEEKDEVVTFPFVGFKDNELQFDGLIYRKISDETMQIILKMKNSEGALTENIIDCQKMRF